MAVQIVMDRTGDRRPTSIPPLWLANCFEMMLLLSSWLACLSVFWYKWMQCKKDARSQGGGFSKPDQLSSMALRSIARYATSRPLVQRWTS